MTHLAAPPDPHTTPPRLFCPPGSVDAHLHLFGPQSVFPLIADPPYLTGDALPESCMEMHHALGIDHGVVVSGGAYGRDTSHLISVLERWPQHFRGVAVLPEIVDDEELMRLNAAGVRGIRFVGDSGGHHVAHIEPYAASQVAELGWHVQFVAQPGELETHAERLRRLPTALVLDHFGGLDARRGTTQPGFKALLELLDTGRAWVKFSGPMYCTTSELPYPEVVPLAHALLAHAPERIVWGSDWPHLHMGGRSMPNDAALLDLLLEWVPDQPARDRVLGQNARELYGFPEPGRTADTSGFARSANERTSTP